MLTFDRSLTVFQKSRTCQSAFATPVTDRRRPASSDTPRRITPPSVFANAEYVSQMLLGNPLRARLASTPTPSAKPSRAFTLYDTITIPRIQHLSADKPTQSITTLP